MGTYLYNALANLLGLFIVIAEVIWTTICMVACAVIRAIEVFVHVDYMNKIESAITSAAIVPCVWICSKLCGEETCETVDDVCNRVKESTNCNDACDI